MEKFAGYGFNKSHSAAYAYLAFVTAYLKAHYPLEFMSALLTSEAGNTAKVVKYINECREMGIKVLPPDVNSSDFTFTPVTTGDAQGIRFGLGAIKNVGLNAVESIVKARTEGGPFTSIYDFCERVDLGAVNRRMIESFIKAGAMDSLGGNAVAILRGDRQRDRDRHQGAEGSGKRAERAVRNADGRGHRYVSPAAECAGLDGSEKLTGEKEILGFYITGHPLDQYMDKVRELATHQTSTLEGLAKSTEVALCGILTGVNRRRNKDGKLWASMALEDLEGSIEAMVFSTQYERLNPVLNEDKAVLVRGLVLPEENAPPKLSVQDIVPLENASVNLPSLISIRVPVSGPGDVDRCGMLQTLFTKKPGATEVRLEARKEERLLGYPGRDGQGSAGQGIQGRGHADLRG